MGYSTTSTISKISDITVTDDSFFCVINEINHQYKLSSADPEECYRNAALALGDSIDMLYALPKVYTIVSSNAGSVDTMKSYFPSTFKLNENLLSVLTQNPSYYPYIIVPGLKRVFDWDTGAYRIDGDNLIKLPAPSDNLTYGIPGIYIVRNNCFLYSCVCIGLGDGVKYNEVLDGYFGFLIYDDGKSVSSEARIDSAYKSETAFNNHFGDYSPPDFDSGDAGPYDPGGDSGPGTLPPGTFDDRSDPIPDSPLPTISAADTGFTRIYNPTLEQVQALARYLWTEPSIIQTIWNHIKQFFEDPMQAIIGFNLVPCVVPDGGTRNFSLLFVDTGVEMTAAASQFVDVDCGTLVLDRYYGSAIDQNPYTKVSCYLPYIGTVHLNTDEVMGTTLQVKYRIDIVSGSCVAKILVDGSVLYQYSGHCAITIPISSADFSSYVSAAMAVGTAMAGLAAGAANEMLAATAGVAQQTGVQSTGSSSQPALPPSSPAPQSSGSPAQQSASDFARSQLDYMRNNPPGGSQGSGTQASFLGLNPENVVSTVGQVMGGKMQVEHSGAFSGNSGYLGVRRPFLIIERPNMCLPATYGQLNGYPSMITLNLSECTGFTKVQQVQLTGCTATNPEQSEILQFLKSGVIL